MSDNRNTILAVILSGLVLIGWQFFFNIPQMEKQRATEQAQKQLQSPAPSATPNASPGATPGSTPPQPGSTTPSTSPAITNATAQPPVSREAAIAAASRIKIETPQLNGSISLRGARLDDLELNKFRVTVDQKSPPIVLFSPSGTAEPYYAEFGWVAAAGTSVKMPDQNTQWQQEGNSALTPSSPVTIKYDN
ncbi:MAG: rane protein insertase YidC, partial [Tardiphaga sp.]|nr:rane protein insertase YidC [Tardiphaga sp.]